MNNRTLLICLLTSLALAIGTAYAGVSRTTRYLGTPAMCWRDGTAMNQSNVVVGVVDMSEDGFEPPSTNAANRYCGPGDTPSVNSATPPAVGYNETFWTSPQQANGQILGLLEASGTVDKHAMFRSFSAYSVTQAAYYANGAWITLTYAGGVVANYNSYLNNLVNPAYSMLALDGFFSVLAGAGGSSVSGSVNSVAGGANNTLDNAIIAVYWRSNVPMTWQPLQNFGIAGNGDFTGSCPNDTTEFMVGLTNGPDALPNSLLGQGPVPVPEPTALALLLSAACLVWGRRA